jgi:hypothetical protein
LAGLTTAIDSPGKLPLFFNPCKKNHIIFRAHFKFDFHFGWQLAPDSVLRRLPAALPAAGKQP